MTIEYIQGTQSSYIQYGAFDNGLKLMTIIFKPGHNLSNLENDCSSVVKDVDVPAGTAAHVHYHNILDDGFGGHINTLDAPHGHFQGSIHGAILLLMKKKQIDQKQGAQLYTFIGGE